MIAALALGALCLPAQGKAPLEPGEAAAWKPGMRAAQRYAEDRAGSVRFAVVDTRGRLREHRGYGTAAMASTFKVMLMTAYLRKARNRELTGEDKSLIRPMIRRSDNETATRIRDMLGRGPIEELADDAGMKDFAWHDIWGYCRTTARDQAFFMRRLHKLVPGRYWDFARKQLAQIVDRQRWGFGRVDTNGWKLFFKGGWGSGSGAVDHQIALLKKGKHRIGIAILTESSPSHDYGKQTLKGVAKRLLRGLP